MWTIIVAIVLGIIEGLTEFIPVSSTGHLIVFNHIFGFEALLGDPDKAELFEVVIQLGAVLAVGFLYRRRLIGSLTARSGNSPNGKLRLNLVIAFLPVAIIGFLFHHAIKTYLFSPITVACTLILGGLAIMFVERTTNDKQRTVTLDSMSPKNALMIGFAQVLSLIPGTSRSAATIVGGMLNGVKRASAAEFSFMLSFPVMIAASVYELFKYRHLLTSDMIGIVAVGFITAFIVSLAVVSWLIRYVQRHDFTGFGVYRIAFGLLILYLHFSQFFE